MLRRAGVIEAERGAGQRLAPGRLSAPLTEDPTGAPGAPAARVTPLARIMLVAAADAWCDEVQAVLRAEWLEVDVDHEGLDVERVVAQQRPDLVVVQIALPARSGVAICKAIRTRSSVPLLALSGEPEDFGLLASFAVGVDTVVPKGVPPRELLARIRALLRRHPPLAHRAGPPVAPPPSFDAVNRTLSIAGRAVPLTDHEVEIVEVLVRRGGRVVTKAELVRAVGDDACDSRTLDHHVRRLRDKLEAADPHRCIQTVRGVGFRFVAAPSAGPGVGPAEPTDRTVGPVGPSRTAAPRITGGPGCP